MTDGGRRFARVVVELEIEVTDPLQVAAGSLMLMEDQSGTLGVFESGNPQEAVLQAVGDAVVVGGVGAVDADSRGWRLVSMGRFARVQSEEGWWEPVTLGALPGRDGSGELIEPPGWMGRD